MDKRFEQIDVDLAEMKAALMNKKDYLKANIRFLIFYFLG